MFTSGPTQAIVRDINDPQKLGRIRCFCPGLMGSSDTPSSWTGWATADLPLGSDPAIDSGSINVPPLGSVVNLTFRDGNIDFPVYSGGCSLGKTPSTSTIPKLGKGLEDGSLGVEETVAGVEVPNSSGGSSQYPHNRVVKTPAGHLVELDDTTGNRRLRIRHADGSFIELRSLGDLLFYVMAGIVMYAATSIRIASKVDVVIAAGGSVKLGGETGTFKKVARDEDDVTIGTLSGLVTVPGLPVALPVSFIFTKVGSIPSPPNETILLSGVVVGSSVNVVSL